MHVFRKMRYISYMAYRLVIHISTVEVFHVGNEC